MRTGSALNPSFRCSVKRCSTLSSFGRLATRSRATSTNPLAPTAAATAPRSAARCALLLERVRGGAGGVTAGTDVLGLAGVGTGARAACVGRVGYIAMGEVVSAAAVDAEARTTSKARALLFFSRARLDTLIFFPLTGMVCRKRLQVLKRWESCFRGCRRRSEDALSFFERPKKATLSRGPKIWGGSLDRRLQA